MIEPAEVPGLKVAKSLLRLAEDARDRQLFDLCTLYSQASLNSAREARGLRRLRFPPLESERESGR
jgi:hypothetical protein